MLRSRPPSLRAGERIGETATPEQVDALVARVKQAAPEKKGLVGEAEFRELVRRVKG